MLLVDALRARDDRVITLVGGGGKTTTMYRLAREFSAMGDSVVVTTTTRIAVPAPDQAELTIVDRDLGNLRSRVRESLRAARVVGVGSDVFEDGKLKGIPSEWVAELARVADRVVVEADGAAEKPFKAPSDYEPVIPDCSGVVVAVVGVEAVGLTLAREHVHRPERIQAITGLYPGEVISPGIVAQVMLHPLGIAKGTPPGARIVALINKVEDEGKLEIARAIGRLLLEGGIERVVIGQVRKDPPAVEIMT